MSRFWGALQDAIQIVSARGAIAAFSGLEIQHVPFNGPSNCNTGPNNRTDGCIADTESGDRILWYFGGFDSSVYTPQLVVHELGHVLENRNGGAMVAAARNAVQIPATEFSVFGATVIVPRGPATAVRFNTEIYGWLPAAGQMSNIVNPQYMRGSYNNPNSIPLKEWIADSFVWWVYGFETVFNTMSGRDFELSTAYITGEPYAEFDSSTMTLTVYDTDGMETWINQAME